MKRTLLLLAGFLAACGSRAPLTYEPPAGAGTATLHFESVPDVALSAATYLEPRGCREWRSIFVDEESPAEFRVPAGRPFVVSVEASIPTEDGVGFSFPPGLAVLSCDLLGSFIPVESRSYEARLDVVQDVCVLRFFDVRPDGSEVRVDAVELSPVGFVEDPEGRFCFPEWHPRATGVRPDFD